MRGSLGEVPDVAEAKRLDLVMSKLIDNGDSH